MSEIKLKPCPWCGEIPRVFSVDDDEAGPVYYFVSCRNENCHLGPDSAYFDTEKEAVKAWNSMREKTCHFVETRADFETSSGRVETAYYHECSVCGELGSPIYNYCPYCGAKVVNDA